MVEANTDTLSPEVEANIADKIFQQIDEEIRKYKNWSKKFVLRLTKRFENLARENLSVSEEKLDKVMQHQREIKHMV